MKIEHTTVGKKEVPTSPHLSRARSIWYSRLIQRWNAGRNAQRPRRARLGESAKGVYKVTLGSYVRIDSVRQERE